MKRREAMSNFKNESCYRIATKDCQLHDREKVMTELSIADNVFIFYKTVEGEHRALFSGTREEEFYMIANVLNNNPAIHNFVKLAVEDVENYKRAPNHDDRYTFKAIEYIRRGKLYKPFKIEQYEQY
jgi:hypothetical protein